MAVAGVDVRPEVLEVERQLPRRVGTVDNRERTRRSRPCADLRDREHERRRGGDVADRDRPRPRSNRSEELLRLRVDKRGAGEFPRPRHRAVLVSGRQHFVVRLEPQRADDGVQARRRVRDEDEIFRARADEPRERRPRLGDQAVEATREELDGIALELALKLLITGEDGRRTGAVAAVVEERRARVEEEFQAATVSRCAASSRA